MSEPRLPKTFRLPESLVRELDVRAELDGVSRTAVVETAVRRLLAAAGEGPGGDKLPLSGAGRDTRAATDVSASLQPPDLVDLVDVVAEKTGSPRSLARMFIGQGRVTVSGSVCSEFVVSRSQLGTVALDGKPLDA